MTAEDLKFCKGCTHLCITNGSRSATCDYLLHTGHARGCSVGAGCPHHTGRPKRGRPKKPAPDLDALAAQLRGTDEHAAAVEHNEPGKEETTVQEQAARTIPVQPAPEIRDAGDRTPMGDTGFVRDCHEGKGRMDLLPWHAILEVAQHCEAGARKYGERNIDKGAPLHSLLDSGLRHAAKYVSGARDEDHLRAACWNLLWALEQRTTHPELNDLPWAQKGEPNEDHRTQS